MSESLLARPGTKPMQCEAGTPLYGAGHPSDKVFLLMDGAVTFLKGKAPLAGLAATQGQATSTEHGLPIFGEKAMLDRKPRALSCVATSPCKLLVLPLETWAAVSMEVPELKMRLRRLKDIRQHDLG